MSGPSVLTEHSVGEAARAAGLDAPARFVEVTGSTNADLLAMAAGGAATWSVVVAGHQEAGKGRLGRTWVAPPGSSLLVSVLLRPRVDPADAPLFTLAAGVAAAEACADACGVRARCKWTNDLVVGGRKLGGILAEGRATGGRLEHLVIGLGVNVRQRAKDFPPEIAPGATSVALEAGHQDAPRLLGAYLLRLRSLVTQVEGGFAGAVLDRYRALCETIGHEVRARVAAGRTVKGTAVGIGDRGELVIETADGPASVTFGEVVHLRRA